MRVGHTSHSLPQFPVYSSAFLSEDKLVLGGGGGSSKSGIKNKLILYNVHADRKIGVVHELELERGEDAPMSMAADEKSQKLVCGVNSPEEAQEKGENENCRAYAFDSQTLKPTGTESTLPKGDLEDYQKVTVISPDGSFVAVAGKSDLSLLALSNLSPVAPVIHIKKGEIYDATFSETTLVIATTVNLLVYALPSRPSQNGGATTTNNGKGKEKESSLEALELLKTVEAPSALTSYGGGVFRGARFHPTNSEILYTITNTVPVRSRSAKSAPRQGLLAKWNTKEWRVEKVRKVGDKGLTCFDVSPNGKFIGYGSSDYSVGLVDTNSLAPVVTILKAHEFPPTTLKFNPKSKILVSGSADNTIRIISVPDSAEGQGWGSLVLVIIALLMVLLAVLAQSLMK